MDTTSPPGRRREGVWAKIIRAEEHLAAIRAEAALFAESDPYELVGEFNAEGTEYRAHLVLREAPSIRLQLLLGDFAYNLRSALDHLAWWLVIRNGGVPDRNTAFPIKISDVDKKGQPAPAKIHPRVSVETMTLIEALQPYNRGDDAKKDKLAVLDLINNTDKHRHLFVTTGAITYAQVWLEYGPGMPLTFPTIVQGRFKHGAELAVFPFDPPMSERWRPDVNVQAKAKTLVTFAEAEPIGDKPVVSLLGQLLEYVTDIVVRPIESAELSRTL